MGRKSQLKKRVPGGIRDSGHESLDVTLAYLKGKDAKSKEAREHPNSTTLALYVW